MKTRTLHKALSMLLTAAMVLNMGLTPVFATEGTSPGVSGICTHHTEHTEDCGYKQGALCAHAHTEDCFTTELTCDLAAGDAPEIATDSEATLDSGTAHTHGEDCSTKTDNCKHTHDDTCGYTPDSPCTFDPESCTQCNPGDKPAEKVCTCEPVDSGELVHGADCPLYTAPELSEAVQELIAMVDALPGADTITEENREATLPAFDAAAEAYGALSDDNKAAFEATEQYKKLMALHTALYPIALMANEAEWDMKDGALTLDNTCEANCTHTVTGTSTGGTISVTSGTHNVTLNDVTVDVSATANACAFEITGGATVNLTLTGANTLKSGKGRAGLQVSGENTLTITNASIGSLNVTGGGNGAGIGGGDRGAGGTITISSGTVSATGGEYGAGIGGGYYGTGGTITISDHAVVFAVKGAYAPNHIGGGFLGAAGTVNLNGGIIFEGTSGLQYGTDVTPTSSFTIPSTHMLTIKSGQALTIGDDIVVTNNGTIVNGGSISGTITGNQPISPNPATYNISMGNLMLDSTCGGGTCTGHTVNGNTTTYKIIVESGTHNVILADVEIDVSATESACAFKITNGAAVNLTLTGANTLKSGNRCAGLEVSTGNTLTITEASTGSLGATGGRYGAGIGGGYDAGGTINMNGGIVTATGGQWGAGIGGGSNGAGGTISINGGTVTANGGISAAGIGSGEGGSGGTITINGGTVIATGRDAGAGIGIGGGIITIEGNAVVFAKSGSGDSNHISAGSSGTVNKTSGIVFEGNAGAVCGTSVTLTNDFTIPTGYTLTIVSGQTLDVSGITATNNGTIVSSGTINGKFKGTQPVPPGANVDPVKLDISGADKYVEITSTGYKQGTADEIPHIGDYVITGATTTTGATSNHIMVSGGTHNITLKDASIQLSESKKCAFVVEGFSTVNLTLEGTNVLQSGSGAGLQVGVGNVLTITEASSGSLHATGGSGNAGIGGWGNSAGGTITINGGTVTATGNVGGAGIGGGSGGAGGTITINGGAVTATGNGGGAGIGGGNYGAGGAITINGGTVTATGGSGGAGIGGGYYGAGGNITISGTAVVFATMGTGAPNHIGAGAIATGGTVTKTGGIIFEGTAGSLYAANVTPTDSFTIPAAYTLKIEVGKTLTVSSGKTLTNNGTINNLSTVQNDGTLINKGTLSGNGSLTGQGVIETALTESMISLNQDSYVYTGSAFEPTVTVASTPWTGAAPFVKDTDYAVGYAANTAAGTATVTVTPQGSKLTGSAVNKTFTITKSASALTLTTDKVGNTVIYGDTITFTANVSIPATKARAASANTVEFFCNGTSLGTVNLTEVGGTGSATFAYDTTGKKIPAGENIEITAEYGGSGNLNGVTQTVNIHIQKAIPTIAWGVATQTLTYTGSEAAITAPTVTLVNSENYTGTIQYAFKKAGLFSFLAGYTDGLPTDAGEYKIVATVAADDNYEAADSTEMTLTINKITSTLTINTMAGKDYDGTAIADPTSITSNITNPAVTYTYYKDNGSGAKGDKLNNAPKDAGNYWVEGDIAETGNVTAVTSAAVSFTIAKIDPTITVETDKSSHLGGKEITVTVKITNPADATSGFPAASKIAIAPTNATLKTALVQQGTTGVYTATYTLADYSAGLKAKFAATVPSATTNYNANTTGTTSDEVEILNKYTPTVTLAASSSQITYGNSITLTATVGKNGQTSPLAGTVQFKLGNANHGSPVVINTDGVATLTVGKETLTAGFHGFKAEFIPASGSDYNGKTSDACIVTINKAEMAGKVIITGTPKFGETLTADTSGLSGQEGNDLGTFQYEWFNSKNVTLGNETTYTIQEADIDGSISLQVIPANGNYDRKISLSVKPTKADSTLTITDDPAKTYDGTEVSDPTVSKTGSTEAVSFEWYSGSGATGTPLSSAPINAGSYSVKAILAASNTHVGAEATRGFTISKATGSVTITGDPAKTYDGTAVNEPAVNTNDSDGAVSFEWYKGGTKLAGAPKDAGSYTVKVIMAEGTNHTAATATKDFTIAKAAAPAITYPTAAGLTYGAKLSTSALTGGSTTYGKFAWEDGNIVPTVANSGYSVKFTPSEATLKNYEAITPPAKDVAVTVAKAAPAIDLKAQVSGDTGSRQATLTTTLTKVGDGEIPTGTVKFVNTTGSDADIGTVSITNGVAAYAWTGLANQVYKVKAVYSGSGNYDTATATEISFDTRKQNQQNFAIAAIGTKTYGDGAFTLATSGGNGSGAVSFTSSDPATVSISGNTATIHKAGNVTITANKAADVSFNEATATASLTVNKKAISFIANDMPKVVKGSQMPVFTYKPVTLATGDSVTTEPTLTTTAADTNTLGKFAITISGAVVTNADSYTITYVNGEMTIVEQLYTVTVTDGTGGGQYSEGQTVSITANSKNNYTFNGWTASTAVTFANASLQSTSFTMPASAVTITPNWTYNGGGGTGGGNTGGGGGGGGGSTPTPDPKPEIPAPPTTAESNVNSKTDKNGNATAAVAEKDITNAIDKAQKEAKKNGTEANGIAITLNVGIDKKATSLNVTLPQKSVSALIAAKVASVTVKNGLSTVTLDLATLKALAGGDVILSVSKADTTKLSAEAKTAIAGRPVFQFGLTSGGKTVSDFKGGRAGLQIPYTPTTTEQIGNLCGVYVDGNGKVNWLEASSYDPITGMMLISAPHFSTYGIGYKQSTPKFNDVGTHWAKNDIDFVVARGLLTGTSGAAFSPNGNMTRGMFVTALGRLAGVDTKKYSNTKFTDVAATAYYSPYVAWASANSIVSGTGDTTFSPDKEISRQEMAVMLVNYSKAIGYKLPGVHAEVSFTDASNIASWAKDAVKQTQMAGILTGKSGNRFDPTATATRAEVSAMLRRYVELVVNTETAEGWAMNESGQWMYIQDGKRVTGSKTIDGKAYTFDPYGVTTALPPERKYLTYTVQKGDSFWSIALKYKVSMFELAKVNGKTIFSVIHAGEELKVPTK